MVERAAGEPLAGAAQLRAIFELSQRLASIDDTGELIGVLARELSQLILARAGITSLCALSLRERRLFPSSSAGRGPAFFDLERRARRRMVARSFSDSRGGPRHGEPQASIFHETDRVAVIRDALQ